MTPHHAQRYFSDAARFVEVEVDVSELVPLDDKCKARACRVIREVDAWMRPVGGAS